MHLGFLGFLKKALFVWLPANMIEPYEQIEKQIENK
jgi:hypothetical protein